MPPTRAVKRTATDKRRRASQRDIVGGTLSSIASSLEAQHTALQTLCAREQATLMAQERRTLAKIMSQLALVQRYIDVIGRHMSKKRDTRQQQAQWNGDDNGDHS